MMEERGRRERRRERGGRERERERERRGTGDRRFTANYIMQIMLESLLRYHSSFFILPSFHPVSIRSFSFLLLFFLQILIKVHRLW
jgi:hypothetical protein